MPGEKSALFFPKSKGGTDHISNLQLLRGTCNTLKGTRTQEYLLVCLADKGFIRRNPHPYPET